MARVQIKKVYPFTEWDAKRRYGKTDHSVYLTIEMETAKTKAGNEPFVVVKSYGSTKYFGNIDDALKYCNDETHSFARQAGWTPESEFPNA